MVWTVVSDGCKRENVHTGAWCAKRAAKSKHCLLKLSERSARHNIMTRNKQRRQPTRSLRQKRKQRGLGVLRTSSRLVRGPVPAPVEAASADLRRREGGRSHGHARAGPRRRRRRRLRGSGAVARRRPGRGLGPLSWRHASEARSCHDGPRRSASALMRVVPRPRGGHTSGEMMPRQP